MRPGGIGVRKPAPPAPSPGGGRGGWAWLLTASGVIEAELVRGVLEGAGVPVALDRRDASPFAWMHLAGNPNAPVRVLVPASLLEAARLELLETDLATGDEADDTPLAGEGKARRGRSGVRVAVAFLTLVVVAWIVLIEVFGSAPCALRVVCP